LTYPGLTLEKLEGEGSLTLTLSAGANSDGMMCSLRNQLRLDHLNSEERASIVTICEEYNDISFA